MASTSYCSSTAFPASHNFTRYDVFLSFRGEDTRNSFTDHLYDALVRAGLHTFRDDDEIKRGEEVKVAIVRAIEASDVSIVVLSANYAGSTWCLDELLLILEERRVRNHFVLPIFYHVDPSDVRNQRKSFVIQVNSSGRWTVDNVNRWKAALTEVADLAGMVLSGPETKFLKDIVDTIYNKLDRKPRPNLTGIDARFKEIKSWLHQSDSGFLVISAIEGLNAKHKMEVRIAMKLFVDQVPKHMTEPQLIAMFKEFALVDEVNIIKDKTTRASRGCCFVICPSREEADKAVDAFHNKRPVLGASSPLQVKYADGELERLEHKPFIGMLPKNVSESEVSTLFSQYGTLKDLQILRGSQQTSKGCAFVKYETKEQAVSAIEGLNGKHKMEGSTVPLVVKWADTEKERQARKAQKAQSLASTLANVDPSQHPSLFGALPMGYMSPYNGYGYQATGTYGLMQYRLPPMQNQPPFANLSPSQANALRAASPRNYAVPPAGYMGSAYPTVPRLQYPLAFSGGIRPFSGPSSPVPPEVANNHAPNSSTVGGSAPDHVEGPPGANLFIYHIPQDFGDEDLANAFQGYGRVLSSKVFVDKATGVSKCFGFVSYDSPAAAQSAINSMNGFQLGGKKLKVQLKRDNKQNKAY